MRSILSFLFAGLTFGLIAVSHAQVAKPLALLLHQDSQASPASRSLDSIATQLKDPKSDGVSLLTEALRLCGFAIWDENRTKLQDPLATPGLKLAITDNEIRGYLDLYRRGDKVLLANLANAFEPIYKEIGGRQSIAIHLGEIYESNMFAPKRADLQQVSIFVQALGRNHGDINDAPLSNDSYLDPIQALIFMRIISEELRVPIRKSLAAERATNLFASTTPALQQTEAPGWAEDSFAGGITGLIGNVLDAQTGLAKKFGNGVSKANALMSISKFILTYKFLKGTVSVEAPGQPLVRTKNRDAGTERTVVAKFFIDGTGVTDWLKDNRKLFVAIGLDTDAPKSGPLKGAEVSWDIKQSTKYNSKQLIQTVTGTGDLSKQKANELGESRVTFQGKPQGTPIDPRVAMPVEKSVAMVISPQVKSVEMQQDLVDAVTGAIGLKDGPSGLLTPIMETLYRMKWESPCPFDLKVKDWTGGEVIGQLTIEAKGSGHRFTRDNSQQMSIDHLMQCTDYLMLSAGGIEVPTIDPALLKSLPPEQRKQIEEGLKNAEAASKSKIYQSDKPGSFLMRINDSWFYDVDVSDCDIKRAKGKEIWKLFMNSDNPSQSISPPQFTVSVDLTKKIATLTFTGMGKGNHQVIPMNGKGTDEEVPMTPLTNITLKKSTGGNSEAFEIPLKETPLRDQTGFNYYGNISVPFTFGPGDLFSGVMFIDYSVTRKNPPKK